MFHHNEWNAENSFSVCKCKKLFTFKKAKKNLMKNLFFEHKLSKESLGCFQLRYIGFLPLMQSNHLILITFLSLSHVYMPLLQHFSSFFFGVLVYYSALRHRQCIIFWARQKVTNLRKTNGRKKENNQNIYTNSIKTQTRYTAYEVKRSEVTL